MPAPFSFYLPSHSTVGSYTSHCFAAVSVPNRSKKTYCDEIPPPFNSPSGHRRGQMRYRHWRRRQRSQFFDVPDYFPVRDPSHHTDTSNAWGKVTSVSFTPTASGKTAAALVRSDLWRNVASARIRGTGERLRRPLG